MASSNNFFTKLKNKFGSNSVTPETTLDKFKTQVGYLLSLQYVFGCELTKEWQFNNRTIFGLIGLLVQSWGLVYSFHLVYKTLLVLVLIGGSLLCLMSLVKYMMLVLYHHKFFSLMDFAMKFFERNCPGKREAIFAKIVEKIALHFKIVSAGVFLGLAIYCIWPFYDFLINGNLTAVCPVYWPFTDNKTLKGYLIESALNIFISGFPVIQNYAFLILFLIFVDVYEAMVCVMEYDLKEFDNLCEINNPITIPQRRAMFRNIMLQAMDLARYTSYMNELFNVVSTVQITCCYGGAINLLFAFLANNYVSGLGGTSYFLTDLLMFCFVGQLLASTNKMAVKVIYSSKWYIYSIPHQKDIRFLIHLMANIQPIYIAGIYPVNFETALAIITNFYQTLMLMLELLT